jgi:thiamine-phosphate pyrophosphorylase
MSPWTDSLYAIIDAEAAERPLDLARWSLRSGCAMLQLRAKRLEDRRLIELAREIRTACAEAAIPFVVNDRPDIARMVGADGVHLGQDDLAVGDARRVVGNMEIGVSTHNLEQAIRAEGDGADLIAFGPVFGTMTKENPDPVVGLESLGRVCRAVSRPVIAIGGITPENAAEAFRAGARYIAVISALPRFLRSAG